MDRQREKEKKRRKRKEKSVRNKKDKVIIVNQFNSSNIVESFNG